MPSLLFRRSRHAAFTFAEMMVALGIFTIGGAIVYPLLVGDLGLYARNFSINKSDNSLRYSLQMLRRDIDMGVEPPVLMGYGTSGGNGVLSAVSSTTFSAQAILIWVNLGPAYDLVPTAGAGTGGTISPASGVTLRRALATPTVQIGDRLVILSPGPYTTGMPDAKSTCGAVMPAPGRRITAISNSTATSLTVSLDLTTSLPSGIMGDQTAYIVREVAYAATTINNSSGTPAERDLIYYGTTSNMAKSRLLVRDLDPLPQEIDTNTNATIQPFNFYGGRASLSPLSVCLPIRAFDYARALNDRNLGTAPTNTSATEFDVYLRSTTQIGVKALLD